MALSGADLERLEHMERQLAVLWENVQHGVQRQDERHGEMLGLYSTLREQIHTQTDRESLGLWVTSLLEQRLITLQGEPKQENAQRAQVRRLEQVSSNNEVFA